MMRLDNGTLPHLVVLRPGSDRGRRIPLDRDYLVVGREHTCDVLFDDPGVSRTHATLQRRGNSPVSSSTYAMPPDIPAAKFRPVGPSTTTRPPVMYSHP